MGEFGRDKPDDTGYLQAPHGLWTVKVSTGARVLLGWLHSHTDQFLNDRVTERYARQVMGTSSVSRWLVELEKAGYVFIDRPGPRKASRFTLLMDPWWALRRQRPTGPVSSSQLAPSGASNWPGLGSETGPIPGHIEEQVGKQVGGDTSYRAAATENPLYTALIEACGLVYAEMTATERNRTGIAVRELEKVGATPEELHRRAAIYRDKYDAALTPSALKSQWAACRIAPVGKESAFDRVVRRRREGKDGQANG